MYSKLVGGFCALVLNTVMLGGLIAQANQPVTVVITTSEGVIEVELNAEKAPASVKNFLSYVNKKHYDNTVFHRVISDFMIQGGGFAKTERGIMEKPTENPVKNEAKNGLKNQRGTIAMARTRDPHSATAQFFINVKDNQNLDFPSFDGWGYAVFGRVTKGMDVVDRIKNTATGRRRLKVLVNGRHVEAPMNDVPAQDVIIQSVRVKGAPSS
jgi:cyclophilin family peptidyl-prolyl cis-trans isomerase